MLKAIFTPSFSSQSCSAFFIFFIWQNVKKYLSPDKSNFFRIITADSCRSSEILLDIALKLKTSYCI